MAFDPTKFLKPQSSPKSSPPASTSESGIKTPPPETPTSKSDKSLKSTDTSSKTSPSSIPSESKSEPKPQPVDLDTDQNETTPSPDSTLSENHIDQPDKPEPPKTVTTPQPKLTSDKSSTNPTIPLIQMSEFYSRSVRMVKKNNEWYFLLKDILAIIDVPDNDRYLAELKNKEELNDQWDSLAIKITFKENDQEITELFANKDNLIKLIRHMDKTFPGAFVGWLNRVSQLQRVAVNPTQPAPAQPTITPN